jgi:transcriptional regulator with XRE-family HTH domain
MSTPFWDNSSRTANIPCGTQDVVQKGQAIESLADYVRRVRAERGWSLAEVEQRSGGGIGRTHINRIETGEATNPSPRKLQALARGLDVSEDELFERARGVDTNEKDFEQSEIAALFYDYKNLSEADQGELKAIWDMLKADIQRRKQKIRT